MKISLFFFKLHKNSEILVQMSEILSTKYLQLEQFLAILIKSHDFFPNLPLVSAKIRTFFSKVAINV